MENENLLWFVSDLTTTNAVSRPLSAPVVSSSAIVDNSSDRSKDTSIINTDVTVSLKKNRSGEDKGTIIAMSFSKCCLDENAMWKIKRLIF